MASPKYSLNKEDGQKILKGMMVAVAGAALTYVAEMVPNVDFGSMTPVVTALAAVLVNAARKWLKDQ